MRVGVLGGTFDPPHIAHLTIAEEARVKLALDEVLFVPAGQPPHKVDQPVSPAEHRVAMVELAIQSNPAFRLSLIDVERPGPSYTVDLIEELRSRLGPGATIYFIVGLDSLQDLPTWHKPNRLLEICRLVAATRPLYLEIDWDRLDAAIPEVASRVILLDAPELNVSSSNLQQRVARGLPIKYQVLPEVEEYIFTHHLYQAPVAAGLGLRD